MHAVTEFVTAGRQWRKNAMNLDLFDAFRAVMQTGTISAAGDVLGRSQPAVSRMLDRLEYELGIKLFDRRKGRIIPTAEAHLLLDEVDRAFTSLGSLNDFAKRLHSGEVRRLSFAVLPALGTTFMADILARFYTHHPNVRVAMHVSMSTSVEHSVATRQVDFGLAETPFTRTSFETQLFIDSEYLAILPPGHPLAEKSVLGPTDLANENIVGWSPIVAVRRRFDDVMYGQSAITTPAIETNFSSSIFELVKRGLGIGIIDPFTAYANLSSDLVLRRFSPRLAFRIAVMKPIDAEPHPLADDFLKIATLERDRILGAVFHNGGEDRKL